MPLPPSVVPGLHKRGSAVSLHKSRPGPSLPSSDFPRRADHIHAERSDSYAGFAHLRSAPVNTYSAPSVEVSSSFLPSAVHISGPTSNPSSQEHPVEGTVHASQHVLPPKNHPSFASRLHEETSGWSDPPLNLPIPSPPTESTRRGPFRSGKSLIRLGRKKSLPEPQSSKPTPPKAPKPKKRLASLFDLSLEVYSTYV